MKLIKPLDIALIVTILCVTVCFFLFNMESKNSNLQAVVRENGTVIKTIDLATVSQPYTIDFGGDYHIAIMVDSDGVAITHSDCNDQICVHTGMLTYSGSCAVCLPARFSVELVDCDDNIDAVVG